MALRFHTCAVVDNEFTICNSETYTACRDGLQILLRSFSTSRCACFGRFAEGRQACRSLSTGEQSF